LNRKIDGLIYFTYTITPRTEDYFLKLSKELPVVFMDYAYANNKDISLVATNGYNGSRETVRLLYEKGKRRIAYINFPRDANITMPRFYGYLKGLEDCGLPYNGDLVYLPDSEPELDVPNIGYAGTKELLSHKDFPDTIMVAADPLAVGAMKFLREKRIRIPGEISIVGFDNNYLCECIQPSLTTIAQPIKELGYTAAKIIISKINGIDIEDRVIFDCELIQRETF
jgi:LacI family transcriptional regulator